jgi:hypothetical protein
MNGDHTFRLVLIAGALLAFPIAIYHRLKAQSSQ